jgi:hypothetical protein
MCWRDLPVNGLLGGNVFDPQAILVHGIVSGSVNGAMLGAEHYQSTKKMSRTVCAFVVTPVARGTV